MLVLYLSVLYLLLVEATPSNRTIDDQLGDSVTGAVPVYAGGWSYGPSCATCYAHPDELSVFDQSWHDTSAFPDDTEPRNVSFSFNGTDLWVFCVLGNYIEGVATLTNLSFELDGATVSTYVRPAPESSEFQSSEFQYNVTVFSVTSLENTNHTLAITPRGEANASLLLFDWAIYTFDSDDDASSTSTSSTSVRTQTKAPAIVGGTVGGLGALILGLAIYWYYRRHGRNRCSSATKATNQTKFLVDPFTTHIDGDLSTSKGSITPSPFRDLDYIVTNRAADIRADRSSRERSEAETRLAELTHQMQELQERLDALPETHGTDITPSANVTSAPSLHAMDGSPGPTAQIYNDNSAYELQLSRQMEAFRVAIEQLRMEVNAIHAGDLPPAYDQA